MQITNMLTTIDDYARTQPDMPVYDVLGESHTYAELKHDSDELASYIDSLSIPPKSLVMVFGGQQYEMLATFIGLSKSGHAYIPVDVNSANDRILDILKISQPSLIIAIDPLPVKMDQIPVMKLADLHNCFKSNSEYVMTHPVIGNDNYYIIFTSGTTGLPKGVQISHNNLLSFTNWMINSETFQVPAHAKMLAQPAYSFDLSVMYWAPTLAIGGTLYALPKQVTENFKTLFSVLPKLPIDVWTSTPSFADMAMLSEDFNEINLPSLQYFYFDGEELTVNTAKKLHERFPKAKIINAYGPTEATVALSAVEITPALIDQNERLPIGYPKPDSPTFIIDDNGEELPIGEMGEIVVTGPGVSKGYINNPEKTEQAFFIFHNQPAYHTGDLGYFDSLGVLHYGGRLDFQIKFNGFRIELEEVSQVLNTSQYVSAAVAVPRYNKQHKVQNLLAFIKLRPDIHKQFENDLLLTKAIKNDIKQNMMPYMMPSRFLYRDELPLTPNGKIDIKSLISEVNKQ